MQSNIQSTRDAYQNDNGLDSSKSSKRQPVKTIGKKNKNPFIKSIQQAKAFKKEQNERQKREMEYKQINHGNSDETTLAQFNLEGSVSPADLLINSGHLPMNSQDYLDLVTKKVDTSYLMEIVQIFCHKQNMQSSTGGSDCGSRSGTNDYVVIVHKINCSEIKQFYGNGNYLLQIWKNKKRLFQHVHDHLVKSIHLNKTELCYVLDMPTNVPESDQESKAYDSHLNFIYIVQPFTQNFARVKYPFGEDRYGTKNTGDRFKSATTPAVEEVKGSGMGMNFQRNSRNDMEGSKYVLFINDSFLVVAEGRSLKYAKTDLFFSKQLKHAGHELKARGKPSGNQDQQQKRIKYFKQQDPYDTTNDIDKYGNFALNASIGSSLPASSSKASKEERRKQKATSKEKNKQKEANERAQSPGGLEEHIAGADPLLAQKFKEMHGNASLYKRDYKEHTVENIDFKSSLNMNPKWNILAIDQTKSSNSSAIEGGSNQIIIYAAKKTDELVIQLFSLQAEKINNDDEEQHQQADDNLNLAGVPGLQIKSGNNNEAKRDLVPIGSEKGPRSRDQYVAIKVFQINENNVMTVLQTRDGHLDIMGNLLDDGQDLPSRFTDKIGRQYLQNSQISEVIFGAQTVHVQFKASHLQNGKTKEEFKTFQFGINYQNNSIEENAKKPMENMMSSLLDEGFIQAHIQQFDDVKIQNSLLLCAYGQVVSVYNLLKREWCHFYSTNSVSSSNRQAKSIMEKKGQPLSKYSSHSSSEEEESGQLLEMQESKNGISDHCYFNKKQHEVGKMTFMQQKTDNCFNFMVQMVNGRVRKVSIIYPTQKNFDSYASTIGKINNKFTMSDNKSSSINDQRSLASRKAYSMQPKIICQRFISKDSSISKQKKYSALEMFSQTNTIMYRLNGEYESRVYVKIQDQDKLHIQERDANGGGMWCPDIYTSDQDNQMFQFLSMDNKSASYMKIVQIENARTNHLFYYNTKTGGLHIFNVELVDDVQEAFTFQQLQKERLITILPKFDYRKGTNYLLDVESILYAWKGNLIRRNIVTGERQEIKFENKIMGNYYQLYARLESKQVYYRTENGNIYFADLLWGTEDKVLSFQIFKNQSTLNKSIEYDPINNQYACFTTPTTLCVFPNLGSYQQEAEGSFNFKSRFIAKSINRHPFCNPHDAMKIENNSPQFIELNKYQCPSEFVANICALDANANTIKVWNAGTGHMISEKNIAEKSFRGYKFHNEWNECTLVLKDRKFQLNEIAETARKQREKDLFDSKTGSENNSTNGRIVNMESVNIRVKEMWENTLLAHKDIEKEKKSIVDIWRKVRVLENGVVIMKEFQYNLKEGSRIFVGSEGDMLLDFNENRIEIRAIRNDGKTEFVDDLKRPNKLNVPAYFSEDFKKYIKYDYASQKENSASSRYNRQATKQKVEEAIVVDNKIHFQIFHCKVTMNNMSKQNQYEKFKQIEGVMLPAFKDVKQNDFKLPYIYLNGRKHLTYINILNMEQSLMIKPKKEIKKEMNLIHENYLYASKLNQKTELDVLNFTDDLYYKKYALELFETKCRDQQDFNVNLKYLNDIQEKNRVSQTEAYGIAKDQLQLSTKRGINTMTYEVNNIRILQAYHFNAWRVIEMIVKNEIQWTEISPEKLKELMKIILPNGDTLLSILVKQANLGQLYKLISVVQKSRQTKQFIPFEIIPDIKGSTPLHECVHNTYTKAAEQILKLLSGNPLDDHSKFIMEIIPDLIEKCPMAATQYFSERQIKYPWAHKQTKGNLRLADETVDFGVHSMPMFFPDPDVIDKKLFVKENVINRALQKGQELKRLPMSVHVFDFPKMHHFSNENGKELVLALSEQEDLTIFDQKFVQAILEYQWPPVRRAIIEKLMIPYMIFLVAFNYYAVYQFEEEYNSPNDMALYIDGCVVKLILVLFSLYFLSNEYVEMKNESTVLKYMTNLWNCIDVIPILLVNAAIILSMLQQGHSGGGNMTMIRWQRYLNASASFFMWFKFLYFFRIFRLYGHLIKMITEVMIDSKVFMVIIAFAILAFSGSFYILSQNNPSNAIPSWMVSVTHSYELMLGNFDTTQFGEVGYVLQYVMFVISSMFLIVIMLNLLIAIISDTYTTVQDQAERKMYQEFAELICENYHLLGEQKQREYDSHGNYLYCSQIQQANNSSNEDLLHPEGIYYEDPNDQTTTQESKSAFGILSKGGQELMSIIEHVVETKFQKMFQNNRASQS